MLKKIWADPVWSKVIATAIIGASAALSAYFAGWWPYVADWMGRAYEFLVGHNEVPNWILGISALCALAVLCFACIAIWVAVFEGKQAPSYLTYTQDNFFGIRWRWRYYNDGGIYHIASFCPSCDLQIHPHDVSAYRAVEIIQYRCDDCGSVLANFDEPPAHVEDRVVRQIQKKLRAGLHSASGA